MKKVLFGALSLITLSLCVAYSMPPVWNALNTRTADTTKILCPGTNYVVGTSSYTSGNRTVLHGVCVNDLISNGTIAVYNSSSTATNAFAILRASTTANGPCAYFDVELSSGGVYSTSAANDVTFLYQCY